MTTGTVFYALVFILDAAAILAALWRTQGAERTLMWVFAILAFPALGALAYFFLANPSVKRTTSRRRAATMILSGPAKAYDLCAPKKGDTSMISLAAAATCQEPTDGNLVVLLPEAPGAFDAIMNAIKNAEKSVWVEFYIINRDETGERFLRLLAEVAKRGVEVRLLFDAVGSLRIDDDLISEIKTGGGKVEAFHPLSPFARRWSVHLRNHRKLVIIDGKCAMTGSMNVGNEYSWRFLKRGMTRFQDVHLSIEGPAVLDFCIVFAEDWAFAVGEPLPMPSREQPIESPGAKVVPLPSGPDQEINASALLYFGGITSATKSVWLTTPYFIPDESISRALESAAIRGVDVRIIVPAKTDAVLVGPAGRHYFRRLLKSGVRILENSQEMLHSKTMVIDGEMAMVGSANLDIRSMRLNFELGVLVADPQLAGALADRFRAAEANSREVLLEGLMAKDFKVQALERFARLLSPIL